MSICLDCGAGMFMDRHCPNCGSSRTADEPPRWARTCMMRDHDVTVDERGEWFCSDCSRGERKIKKAAARV